MLWKPYKIVTELKRFEFSAIEVNDVILINQEEKCAALLDYFFSRKKDKPDYKTHYTFNVNDINLNKSLRINFINQVVTRHGSFGTYLKWFNIISCNI